MKKSILLFFFILSLSCFAQNTSHNLHEDSQFSWFFQKFGDSTFYIEPAIRINPEEFTSEQYQRMFKEISDSTYGAKVASVLVATLYKAAFENKYENIWRKYESQMYNENTIEIISKYEAGVSRFLTSVILKNERIAKFAIEECDANRFISGEIRSDLWKRIPLSKVQIEAYKLLTCAEDVEGFFKLGFTRTPSFVQGFLKHLFSDSSRSISKANQIAVAVLQKAPRHLQEDQSVILDFFNRGLCPYPYISSKQKTEKKFIDFATKSYTCLNKDILSANSDSDYVIEKVFFERQHFNPSDLSYLSINKRSNVQLITRLIEKSPAFYKFAEGSARRSLKLLERAVIGDPSNIKNVPEDLVSIELVKKSVEASRNTRNCTIPEKFQRDKKLLIQSIRTESSCISQVPVGMFDKEIAEVVFGQDLFAADFKYLTNEMLLDPRAFDKLVFDTNEVSNNNEPYSFRSVVKEEHLLSYARQKSVAKILGIEEKFEAIVVEDEYEPVSNPISDILANSEVWVKLARIAKEKKESCQNLNEFFVKHQNDWEIVRDKVNTTLRCNFSAGK